MSFLRRRTVFWVIVIILATATVAIAQTAGSGPGLFGAGPKADESVVAVQAEFSMPAAGDSKASAQLAVTATIKPGWHIYSTTQGEGAAPTVITVKWPKGVRAAGKFRPTTAPVVTKDAEGNRLENHEGVVTWVMPIAFDQGVDPTTLQIPGSFSFGACDATSCRMPEDLPFKAVLGRSPAARHPGEQPVTPAAIASLQSDAGTPSPAATNNVAAAATAQPTATSQSTTAAKPLDIKSLIVELALAFLGGLILNVMPCVLPVISLKILAFVQQAGESRGRIFALNVWYSLGMLAVFMVLAALASGIALAGGRQLGWGQQFTNEPFKITLTALVFVMALSLLGLWEIPIPGFFGSGRANDLQNREGFFGAFCKGVFTTVLATPCSGPFLGPVFGSLLGQPASVIYGVFGAIGLGMASPYLLIGAFPSCIRFLPKPGEWMETFKQIVGFLTMAAVIYLFSLLEQRYVLPTMTLLLGLAVACWWIGRTQFNAPAQRWNAWAGGAAVAAALGWFAFTVLLTEAKIVWRPFSSAAVAQARAQGKTVLVDFTANWCPNCKWNSKWAIETDAVEKLIRENDVEPLLADWSQPNDDIQQTLNRLGANSIPCLAVWPAGQPDDRVIVRTDLLTQKDVLDALRAAGPSRKAL